LIKAVFWFSLQNREISRLGFIYEVLLLRGMAAAGARFAAALGVEVRPQCRRNFVYLSALLQKYYNREINYGG